MSQLLHHKIADGIFFSQIIDPRFKENRISINFVTPLSAQTVTANAMIGSVLKDGTNDYPDFTRLARKLEELYGAYLLSGIEKLGGRQICSLTIGGLDDRFALQNEPLTKELCEVLCSILLHPVLQDGAFSQKYVELEKAQLIDDIEAQINEKRTYAINQAIHLAARGAEYGIPKFGYVEKAREITPASLKQAYDDLLCHSRIEIMFTGCGEPQIAMEQLRAALLPLARDYQEPAMSAVSPVGLPLQEKTEKIEVNQAKMVLLFTGGIIASDPLLSAARLMTAMFGGTVTSKLFVNVREKLSLCYYCAARYDRLKSMLMVDSGVEKENIEVAREEILRQFDAIKQGDFTADEWQSAVLSLKNSFCTMYDDTGAMESWYLGQLFNGTQNSPQDEIEKLTQVTREQIIEAANRFTLDTVYVLTGLDD